MQQLTIIDYAVLGLLGYGFLWLLWKLLKPKKLSQQHTKRSWSLFRSFHNKQQHRKISHVYHVIITKEQHDALNLLRADDTPSERITKIVQEELDRRIIQFRAENKNAVKDNRKGQSDMMPSN